MDNSLTNQHKCQMMFKLLMIYHSPYYYSLHVSTMQS